jgi:hypothetical protein
MGDIPTPVNNTANALNEAIQIAIFDVALNAMKAYALVQMPWLAWPVVNQIFNLITKLLGNYIYTFLSQVATFAVIDMQTDAEKEAYSQALTQLLAAYSSGDQNAIQRATTDVKQAMASLIHFDGSASLQLRASLRLRKSYDQR